jgi:acyl dehydratase
MSQRVFTTDDQLAFAKLSGDYNPLHMDPLIARRLLFGRPVVHGLHALLWGLDCFLKTDKQGLELRAVKANFQAGIAPGQTVHCLSVTQHAQAAEIQLESDQVPALWAQVAWRPLQQRPADRLPAAPQEPGKCRERSLEEVLAASGDIPLYLDSELAARLLPNLARALPPQQLAVLLATTRLIGMECPGLHSIYAGLDLTFCSNPGGAPSLNYRVADGSRRLGMLFMDVDAPGVQGRLKTFWRPQPQAQPAYTAVGRDVEPGEFSAQRALIIGGSRGLGEVSAKLLAAGGAAVVITYHQGEEEARKIVADIVSHGGKADCLPWNVLEPPPAPAGLLANHSQPLYLYYFATPFIFGAAKGKFSHQRFTTFSAYYVTGFHRTVQTLSGPYYGLQKIFYPSSAAIDALPLDMGEYCAAKMAGEILCDFLQKAHPRLIIHKPRLPRVATDQTLSLLPVNNQDPVPLLLSHLRCLRQMQHHPIS